MCVEPTPLTHACAEAGRSERRVVEPRKAIRTDPGGDGAEGPLESSQPISARQVAATATANLIAIERGSLAKIALTGPLNAALLHIALGDTLEGILYLENAARHDSDTHHHQERQDVLQGPRHTPPLYARGCEILYRSAPVQRGRTVDYHQEMPADAPLDRLHARAAFWSVEIHRTIDTETSLIGIGRRGPRQLALKIIKQRGDEWTSGAIVRAFDGRGVVHVHEFDDGVLLLDLLSPGHSLASVTTPGDDESATFIIADVIRRMQGTPAPPGCPDVMDWYPGFDRYLTSGDQRFPRPLIEDARARFASLASSERRTRLLHGDLQHYNILFDSAQGWLAIDPKGVIGEVEYEVGAMLRNPVGRPELFVSAETVTRRVTRLSGLLDIDPRRTLEWGYVQAVLSAVWSVEDGHEIAADSPVVRLAHLIR